MGKFVETKVFLKASCFCIRFKDSVTWESMNYELLLLIIKRGSDVYIDDDIDLGCSQENLSKAYVIVSHSWVCLVVNANLSFDVRVSLVSSVFVKRRFHDFHLMIIHYASGWLLEIPIPSEEVEGSSKPLSLLSSKRVLFSSSTLFLLNS